jgi:hypothetical protein
VRASRLEIAAVLAMMALVIVVALLFNGPIVGGPGGGVGPSLDPR